jgi:hypothetical protein
MALRGVGEEREKGEGCLSEERRKYCSVICVNVNEKIVRNIITFEYGMWNELD